MTQIVTIEGSTSPCSELSRGEQRTVVYSDRVKGLERRGFVVVVDGPHDSTVSQEPQIAEGSGGEPNVGHEIPADGTWSPVIDGDGSGETLPEIEPNPPGAWNTPTGSLSQPGHSTHVDAAPEPESIGEGVLGLTLPGS